MFSGIKSMLFGYSDPTAETTQENNDNKSEDIVDKSIETSTSSFERTLNAATSKLTEQLLPQSASIEELQSSSHQILPTLNEQFTEQATEVVADKEVNSKEVDDDDDDGCFNVDSWELLDLVEKPADASDNLEHAVQVEEDTLIERSNSGGILKSGSKKKKGSKDENGQANKEQRFKPKVSFETPDLVNGNKLTEIESGIKNEKTDETGPVINVDDTGKAKKSKKVKRATKKSASVVSEVQEEKSSGKEDSGNKKVVDQTSTNNKVVTETNRMQPLVPKLNYAAALAAKPVVKESSGSSASSSGLVSTSDASAVDQVVPQTSSAVKRNRPVSTSSCSSSDEIETIEVNEQDLVEALKESDVPMVVDAKASDVFDVDDDDESVISSGFSDCDYGYGGLNDYIMRPKKTQRRRNASTSSSKSNANTRGLNKACGTSKIPQASCSQPPKTRAVAVATASKHLKPMKKKLVVQQTAPDRSERKRRSSESKSSDMPASFLKAKTGDIVASNNCSNESSDIAEMDESWYVTPPPCFTGVKAKPQTLNASKSASNGITQEAEAERENSLIEHPSIYIASTSKQVLIEKALTETVNNAAPLTESKTKKIVLKRKHKASESKVDFVEEVATQKVAVKPAVVLSAAASAKPGANLKTSPQQSSRSTKKSTKTTKSSNASFVPLKREKKAWENKFVVTSWDDDEQDDIGSDFDNVFDDLRSPTPKSASSKRADNKSPSKKQQAKKETVEKQEQQSTDSYESDDVSIGSPALDGVTRYSVSPDSKLSYQEGVTEETVDENKEDARKMRAGRKPPTVVKPIEPERRPGWQLRRMRSKRHPLTSLSASNNVTTAPGIKSLTSGRSEEPVLSAGKGKNNKRSKLQAQRISDGLDDESSTSSARSTPTLMDRIGSSIVANLTNLTSGLVASTALPPGYALQHGVGGGSSGGSGRTSVSGTGSSTSVESQANMSGASGGSGGRALVAAMAKSTVRGIERSLVVERKRMSKSYLKRANNCASYAGQRADRRLRMSRTPNGVSIDRKVHSNFH